MKVQKKELVDRTFIPYELTITVSSEKEHAELSRDAHAVRDKIDLRNRILRQTVLGEVLTQIINHTK